MIRQKGESQNKKTKHAKFSEKRIFLTPRYAYVRVRFETRPFALLQGHEEKKYRKSDYQVCKDKIPLYSGIITI